MRTSRIVVLAFAAALSAVALAATTNVDGPQARAVPASLVLAEGLAEDIQTDLEAGSWTMARTRAADLQMHRAALRAVLQPPKMAGYEAAADSLMTILSREDRPAALQAANQVSRAIVGLLANYDSTVPVAVGYLDVAGRDVIYAAETGRWQDASAAALELRANYAAVGPHLARTNQILDGRLRQRFSELDQAVAAKNAAQVRAIATALLDDVDLVEQAY